MLAVAFHMEAEDTKLLLELFRGSGAQGNNPLPVVRLLPYRGSRIHAGETLQWVFFFFFPPFPEAQ